MNTSEKEFQMIYFLIKLSTAYTVYFSRNLSHHEDLAVARFLPRFDEGFHHFLIISATKEIIYISFL